jgi:hypothetical protein
MRAQPLPQPGVGPAIDAGDAPLARACDIQVHELSGFELVYPFIEDLNALPFSLSYGASLRT